MKEPKNPEYVDAPKAEPKPAPKATAPKQPAAKADPFQPFATKPMKPKAGTAKTASAAKASAPPSTEFKTPEPKRETQKPVAPQQSAPVTPKRAEPKPADLRPAVKPAAGKQETPARNTEPVQPVSPASGRLYRLHKLALLVCEGIATLIAFCLIFTPFYTEEISGTVHSPVNSLNGSDFSLPFGIAAVIAFLACFAMLLWYVPSCVWFFKNERKFLKNSRRHVYAAAILPLVYFIAAYFLAFYKKETTASYVPLIFSSLVFIVYHVFLGQLPNAFEENARKNRSGKKFKIEPLIYMAVSTAITLLLLPLNVIKIKIAYGTKFSHEVSLSGWKLLATSHDLEGGFQVFAFVLLAIFMVSGMLFALSLVGFFTKSDNTAKLIKSSIFANFICVFAVALFGLYFGIAQKINEETLLSLLAAYDVELGVNEYIGKVSTQAIYVLIASFVLLVVAFVRGQFKLTETPVAANPSTVSENAVKGENAERLGEKESGDFDACPAFSELDGKIPQFETELANRRARLFPAPTLAGITRFVVDYARESRLHLSYSLEDMANFVAGLGASRLTILQGMSGTGKTSLPKIFTEAVMGNCEIVEVESSWRDKNELLGYYNEFSKCFTPKKFTQCLYKASLNPEVPTFIVLDEMNLSRIEYYFSDFLSLMEHEENKREIKLLNVKLFNTVDGEARPYRALTEGHTVKIPKNVWFIGTANRDESTFEISDKVYDRAQTMDFNKRAPKVRSFRAPLYPQFVTDEMLLALFEQAKSGVKFEAEDNSVIRAVEKLLAPYNISFGNRILKQMEDFVKIYCACFESAGDEVMKEAVDRILLSKVVRKLETKIVTDKNTLVTEFNRLRLVKCSEFAQKLNED